ncbi:MAG: transglutaminase-like domain-containing protein [Clostridium sp.]|nr:transglutaminase-like domain-containing protein [Clostridium sp.]MCM1547527.1 transglutaminase-like domain-containing protein [Ruminococcus sp.]
MNIFEKIRTYILPYMLALFLCISIFGIYDNGIFTVCNFLAAAMILAVFFFLNFVQKHRVTGTLIYVVLIIASLFLTARFIFSDDWGSGFFKWFLSAGEDEPNKPRYFCALLSVFPLFFASVIYYFSNVLYRTSFLMLASLVTCAVYVKVLEDMNDFYMVCIVGLNAAIFAVNIYKKRASERVSVGRNAYSLSIMVTVSAALFISSLIPKQGEAKYYDTFEKYFMDAGSRIDGDYSNLGKFSGNAENFNSLATKELYTVYSKYPMYFRRQSFDLYNSEENHFYPLDKYSTGYYDDTYGVVEKRRLINFDDMLEVMKTGAALDKSLSADRSLIGLETLNDAPETATIIPAEGHDPMYLPASVRTYKLTSSVLPENAYDVTRHGQFISSMPIKSTHGAYSIQYYREFDIYDTWFENGCADFTDEEYGEYLNKLEAVLTWNGKTELCEIVYAFEAEHNFAMEYKENYSFNNAEIPVEISRLAQDITRDCEYDWQKASALRDYFYSGDYTYDTEYASSENLESPVYFLFESKRGTCSDFASAYTLMARSVGLAVRYTEGYLPVGYGNGSFKIFSSGLHAYPEVYIQNTGWTVFEPTVSSLYSSGYQRQIRDDREYGGGFEIDTQILFAVIKAVFVIFSAAAAVIIAVPAAVRIADIVRIKYGGNGILIAYRRINATAGKRFKVSTAQLSPTELNALISDRTGYDISGFILLYERVCFGGIAADKEDRKYAYKIYKTVLKQCRSKYIH